MEKTVKKPGVVAALLIAVSGLFPPMLFVTGGLFGYLLIAGRPLLFLLCAALCAAGAYALWGSLWLWLLAMILPAALCLYVMLRHKAAYFDTALFVSGLYTVTLYLMVSLADILAGSPPFYTLQQFFSAFIGQQEQMLTQMAGISADQVALLQEYGRALTAQLPIYMPAMLCAAGAVLGLCNLLLCVRMCRKAAAPVKPMSPFRMWQLPKSFLYGMLTMAGGILIAPSLGVSALDAVTAAVFIIALLPFAVQGLSVMGFMQQARRSSTASFAFLIVILVFTFPWSVVSLAIVGFLEQIFHIRRRVTERGNPDQKG